MALSLLFGLYQDPRSLVWQKVDTEVGRPMNQGQLEVVKQEMARVNIDTLGISELKWTGTGEFNSDDHYIYYCGQESLRRNGVAIMVNKRVWNAVLGYNLKNDRMISVRFQGKPFSITVIQVYASTSNAEEAISWMVLWRPTRPSRTNTNKRYAFHHRGLECKSRRSRDTWSNRQVWPWNTKWSRTKANRVFPGGSDGKASTYNAGNQVWSLGWEDPLEKGKATHSSIMAWRIPWTKEPGGLQFMELQKSDMTDATNTQSKANRVLPREHAGHSKHPLKTM